MRILQSIPSSLLLIFVAVGLLGCDSLLDVEPQQSIPSESALETVDDLNATLVGAYNQTSDYDLYGGQLMMLPDLLADDNELLWFGTFEEPGQVYDKDILVDNAFIEDQWIDAYEVINIANNVLAAAESIDDVPDRARGQALFLRGVMHFELVRNWARTYRDGDPEQNLGVPIVLQPTRTIPAIQQPGRNTVEEVYDQVISDLSAAKDLLPVDDGVYADTYTASAMLSRVYLMQLNYAGARDEASRVIESGKYGLAPTFAQAFNQAQDIEEYVWAIQISVQDNDNHSLGTFYDSPDSDPSGSGRGDINVTGAHLSLYDEGDERGLFFYVDETFGGLYTSKWRSPNTSNIPVVRFPEMYLTRAEANFRLGTETGNPPFEDVNVVRRRALSESARQNPDNLYTEAGLTLTDILFERKLELSFEGHNLHDLKRTARDIAGFSYTAPNLVYPIPQRELDANPGLRGQQNPGYGS